VTEFRIYGERIEWPGLELDEDGLGFSDNPDLDPSARALLSELAAMGVLRYEAGTLGTDILNLCSYAAGGMEGEDPEYTMDAFGLPPVYSGPVYIEGKGVLTDADFRFVLRFPEAVTALGAKGNSGLSRRGILLEDLDSTVVFRASIALYRLCRTADDSNASTDATLSDRLLALARIQALASSARATLDQVLRSERVVEAGTVKLDIDGDDEVMEVKPDIEIPGYPPGTYTGKFDKRLSVDPVVNLDSESGRTRVVISEEKVKALDLIKKRYRKIRDPDLAERLIRTPPEEFDDDFIDVSALYGERVKGLGIYKPRAYPYIQRTETEWIPGFMNEDGLQVIDTQEKLDALAAAMERAETQGLDTVLYEGTRIDLEDARDIYRKARDRLEEITREPTGESKTKALVIEENTDWLKYIETTSENPPTLRARSVPGLADGVSLKPHQVEGIAWLYGLRLCEEPGAILADDMGLGKTLQVLSFLELCSVESKGIIACIVAPAGLIGNWIAEYRKFFPTGNLRFIDAQRDPDFARSIVEDPEAYRNAVAVFSYETLRRKQLEYCAVRWDVSVLDEAQRIKTPGTLITNAAKALWSHYKVALTGTPVENSFHDLWSIADYSFPGLLGSAKEFATTYAGTRNDSDAELKKKADSLRKKLGFRFLRRIKADALRDLPPKLESDRPEHSSHFEKTPTVRLMPAPQRAAYEKVCAVGRLTRAGGRQGMLDVLFRLKTVSDHPDLDGEGRHHADSLEPDDSAKSLSLMEVLDHIRERGEKAIVFAEYRATQRFLVSLVERRYGFAPDVVNGETPNGFDVGTHDRSRLAIVRRFNESSGFNVVVMSPIAAGVGLTVTGANHVIHYSRHWNPAKEDQATDRAYRIGQNKPVYVYYLVAKHPEFRSFDESLAGLLASKRGAQDAALFPSPLLDVDPESLFDEVVGS